MIPVYSSALNFDLWYKITDCKDSPALSHLFNAAEKKGGEGESPDLVRSWALVSVTTIDQKDWARGRKQPCLGSAHAIFPVLCAHISSIRKGKQWEVVFGSTQNTKAKVI